MWQVFNVAFQATDLQSILDAAKMPAARTLQAANAYEMIVKAVANSSEAADQAKDAAENAASMVKHFIHFRSSFSELNMLKL